MVGNYSLQTLNPGESTEITVKKITSTTKLVIENKDGFVIYDSSL